MPLDHAEMSLQRCVPTQQITAVSAHRNRLLMQKFICMSAANLLLLVSTNDGDKIPSFDHTHIVN
jgi:hypothetical protein